MRRGEERIVRRHGGRLGLDESGQSLLDEAILIGVVALLAIAAVALLAMPLVAAFTFSAA